MKREPMGAAAPQAGRLPRIQNLFLYGYGCLAKLVGALLLCAFVPVTLLVLACFRLLGRRWKLFASLSRSFLSLACRAYLSCLRCICFLRLQLADGDRKKLRNLRAAIVVANHPSLLALPLLLALVPKATCIIGRPSSLPGPFRLLAGAFITAPSWGGLCAGCRAALARGENIVIFPERRLTPRSGTNPYRRTAARLSRECSCGIQPLYIGGSDKYGLGAPAAPLAYCRTGLYRYELKLLPPIADGEYAGLPGRAASVAVTKKIHDEISAEAYLSDYRIV